MKITFKAPMSESKKKALRKALKAAHSPEANKKRGISIRAAFARRREQAKLHQEGMDMDRAHRKNGNGGAIVPLDHIPGERAPVISYSDTPGGGGTSIRDKSRDERLQLAKALVATVYKLVG